MTLTGNTGSIGIAGDRFKPVAYALDRQKVRNLALVAVHYETNTQEQETAATFGDILRGLAERQEQEAARTVDDILRGFTERQEQEIATTVGAVLQGFAERQVNAVDAGFEFNNGRGNHAVVVTMDLGQVRVRGSEFNCDVLAMLLNFRIAGVDAFQTTWLWYDHWESVGDDPYEMYSFFIVHGDAIIRERFSFIDRLSNGRDSSNGFDPTIFSSGGDLNCFPDGGDSDPIWFRDEGWKAAQLRFWYRRFYQETRIGQLMALRSDEPALYHYPEGLRIAAVYAAAPTWPQLSDEMAARIKLALGVYAPEPTSERSHDGNAVVAERSAVASPDLAEVEKWLKKIHRVLWLLASGR